MYSMDRSRLGTMPSLGKNSAEWPWGQAATGKIHPEKSHQKSWAESVVRLLMAMDSSPLRQLLCYLSYTAGGGTGL